MAFLRYRGAINGSGVRTALDCAAAECICQIFSHIDLISFHESPLLQIEPKDLPIAISINSHCRYERLSCPSVVLQISSISWYSCGIVQARGRVELKKTIGLKMQRFAVVGGEEYESLIKSIGVSRI